METNANRLVTLLQRASTSFSKLLVIVDNAHRKGSEEIFVAFNNLPLLEDDEDYYHDYSSHRIRFLFAAREAELKTLIGSLTDRRKANDIRDAVRKLERNKIILDFGINDAILFVENALAVVKSPQTTNLSKENAKSRAEYWYKVAKHDPFVFVYALVRSLTKDKVVHEDFIESEMDEKINSLSKEHDIKAAILCSFMGAFGIPISSDLLQKCGFYDDSLMLLLGTSILFKNGEYAVRHELWALEFLVRIYSKMCNNSESTFDNRYGFGHIIQCVLNNIGINEWLNILYSTANFYDEEHFQPFATVIISNFIRFAENLPSPADKTKLYSYGLGYFHYIIKDHSNAITYYDRALEIEPDSAYIWLNKGAAYHALGEHEDAIKCYDEALKINPKYADALVNKGLVLNNLERYQEAIASYDEALKVEPNDASIWYNKGLTLIILTLYRDAIECFDKALRIKQDYANALVGKGMALYSLAVDEIDIIKNREAAECFDRALEIEPNNAFGGYHRALYKVRQGHIDDGLADLEKAIDIDETLIEQAGRDFGILRNNERFTSLMTKSRK